LPLVIPKEIILGDTFFSFTTGYISYSIQQYYKAIILNSYPVFKNNLALQQSNQFLEVEQQIFNKFLKDKPSKYLVGSNVLLNNEFRWLGNVPKELLIKIRKDGELNEFRSTLSGALNKYNYSKLEDLDPVVKDVQYELNEVFKNHEKEIKEIVNKYKIGKLDAAKLIASGTIGVTGFAFPPIALIGSVLGGATVVDIVNKYFKKKTKIEELERKPIGILYDAYKKSP